MTVSLIGYDFEEVWTLSPEEIVLLKGKAAVNKVGFACLLKFFQNFGRFPQSSKEILSKAISTIARQLGIDASLSTIQFTERSLERYRAEVRGYLGTRPATVEDEKAVQKWLLRDTINGQESIDDLLLRLRQWYQERKIEQPALKQQRRIIKGAISQFENALFQRIYESLSEETRATFARILSEGTDESDDVFAAFQSLKNYPGKARLKTVLAESDKIRFVADLALEDAVFKAIPEKKLRACRRRAEAESIWELRRHPKPIGYALMAIFCFERKRELLDGLVDAFTRAVYDIQLKAKAITDKAILKEEKSVHNKSSLLYKLSKEIISDPDGPRQPLFDVAGGQEILERIIAEYEQQGPGRKYEAQTTVRHIFCRGLRKMLPDIFELLTFRCNNHHHQPVIDAIAYLKGIQATKKQKIDINDVPIDGVVPRKLKGFLIAEGGKDQFFINRIHYETCVMKELRERL